MNEGHTRFIVARRDALHAQLRTLEAQLEAIRAARADDNADDEHDPEGTTLSTEWSRAEGQRSDVLRELDELRQAFDRRAAGTYGVCVSCGRQIPVARLEVLPAASRCVSCAR